MRLLENKDRHIYAQGDLDGACFLYSIVNAFMALTHEEPDFFSICAAFKNIPYPQDFLSGNTGTGGGFCARPELLVQTIQAVLAGLDTKIFHVRRVEDDPFSAMDALINAQSVLILHYEGDSRLLRGFHHWVTGVAFTPLHRTIHVACSVALQKSCFNRCCTYEEQFHSQYGRWSNDVLSDRNPYSIPHNDAFQVRLL